jgi:glycosyltransferase involved in cell wall biosynthesis
LQASQTIQNVDLHTAKNSGSWLQVLSHIDPQYGGIALSVPQLSRATEAVGGPECPIAGFCDPNETMPSDARNTVRHYSAHRMRWALDHSLRNRFRESIRAAHGVHIHGLWEPHCNVAAAAARACKRPYIISAHGMLDLWALRHKRVKKALYAALIEARNLQRAACLRALTLDEVEDYRRVGMGAPIAVVPTGVEVPTGITGDLFWESYPQLAGRRIILFLGRVHRKKGLDVLLEAWSRIPNPSDDVHVVIAGPDDGHLPELKQAVEKLGLEHSVTFAGMLYGERKWSALRAASVFVLPSHSEGFSVAVLEALGMGLPVIVTDQCHFPEVKEQHCGWTIQPEIAQVEEALRDFLQLPPEEAVRMGERGRNLVEKRFTWSVIGQQMADVYAWLEGGPRPANVEVVAARL